MLSQNSFGELQKNLTAAQEIVVILPAQPDFDQVASALSLFLALNKAQKSVSVFCASPMTVEFSSLVGVDKIGQKLGGRNLTIVLDLEESIENVSYNTDEKHLYLTIEPKAGSPAPSAEKVRFDYSGGSNAQFFILIGSASLEELEKPAGQAPTFNLNLEIDPEAASLAEMTAYLISRLGLPMTTDIGQNLLSAIEKTTDHFASPKVGATTFEAAAFCLRAGAKRKLGSQPVQSSKPQPVMDETPSDDWLTPKIYKGNQLI